MPRRCKMQMRRQVPEPNAVHEQRFERTRYNTRGMEQTGAVMTAEQLFNSKRWQTLRAQVLRRDQYLDQILLRYGKRRTANTVHHIFPREAFPEYTFEPWNLISLTMETHNRLHDREGHYLTADGMQLLERTARKHNIVLSDHDRKMLTPPRVDD